MAANARPSMEKIYSGTSRDVYAFDHQGNPYAVFAFADTFSVFDWGRMPDAVPGKGAALRTFATTLYEALQGDQARWKRLASLPEISGNAELSASLTTILNGGFPSAYIPLAKVRKDMDIALPAGVSEDHAIAVKRFETIRPDMTSLQGIPLYDNQRGKRGRVVPLEVIFRFGVPKGSSLIKRGYTEGQLFETPMLECSTKYEKQDRMLSDELAYYISGLEPAQYQTLRSNAVLLAFFLRDFLGERGIFLWDGKFEFAIDQQGRIAITDSITPDELRMTYKERSYSKEMLRQYFVDTAWHKALLKAKDTVATTPGTDWKHLVTEPIHRLTPEQITNASAMYNELAAALTARA